LVMAFIENAYLNSSSFDGQSLSHLGRPVSLHAVTESGIKLPKTWTYLDEKAFKGFFASNTNNSVHYYNNNIDCNDSRNQWFITDHGVMNRILVFSSDDSDKAINYIKK